MYQEITIVGNVGQNPELRYTPAGIAVLNFSVAVSKVTGSGETRKEKTLWFRVAVWRERAETLKEWIKKGHKVLVVGEIDVNLFQKNDGTTAVSIELNADKVKLLTSKAEAEALAAGRPDSDDEQPAPRRQTQNNDDEQRPPRRQGRPAAQPEDDIPF